jgi:nitroreductase
MAESRVELIITNLIKTQRKGDITMNVLEAIRNKRAVRDYAPRPLSEDDVQTILRAGRRAQSSKNSQPWHFLVVQDHDTLMALSKMGDFTGPLTKAAMAVAILTPDPQANYWVMFDAGQAAAYMQLAALEQGIGSCVVALHRPDPSRDLLGYPENLQLHAIIAFGYPTNPADLEPSSRAGGRQPLGEIAHFEHWQA